MIKRQQLPYPGLRAFRADENILFFGREGCVDQMLETLATTRFLSVLGSSGSGKSSLVRTGLLDAVGRGAIVDAGTDWVIADFHPGANPMRALACALVEDGDVDQADALESLLETWPGALVEWAQFGNIRPGGSLLLLVDQFEELFRYSDYLGQQAAEAFVALLLHSAASADVRIHVVLTMRSEYLGNCALILGLAERINQSLYLTPRMDRQSCREAIEGPANVFGFSIEPRLVNQILNDLASFAPFERGEAGGPAQLSRRADQLPLMQHLLNRLWTRADAASDGAKVVLRYEDYEAVGGLEGALQSHGDSIIAGLPPEHRDGVSIVFRALVTGRDAASAVRRAVPFAALEAEAGPAARAVVEAFRARTCNFLRPEDDVPLGPDTLVDISHESLIRQWGLLTGWTKAEAEDGATWQRLIDRETRWVADEGGLLTGRDLATLAQWWDSDPPPPEWAERHGGKFEQVASYLAESRAAETKALAAAAERDTRERRRLITALGLMAILTVTSTGAVAAYLLAGQTLNAMRAEQGRLTAEAQRLRAETTRLQPAIKMAQKARNELQAVAVAREAAERAKVAAEQEARNAIQSAERANQQQEMARKGLADIMNKDPEKSDLLGIAGRALDACETRRDNEVCRVIRGDNQSRSGGN